MLLKEILCLSGGSNILLGEVPIVHHLHSCRRGSLQRGPHTPFCLPPTAPLHTLRSLGHLESCHFLLCQVLPDPVLMIRLFLPGDPTLYLLTAHGP